MIYGIVQSKCEHYCLTFVSAQKFYFAYFIIYIFEIISTYVDFKSLQLMLLSLVIESYCNSATVELTKFAQLWSISVNCYQISSKRLKCIHHFPLLEQGVLDVNGVIKASFL